MVLTNQLIYLVNVKTIRQIFSNYVCFSKSPNFNLRSYFQLLVPSSKKGTKELPLNFSTKSKNLRDIDLVGLGLKNPSEITPTPLKKTFIPSKTNVGDQLLDDTSGAVQELITIKVPLTDLEKCRFLYSDLFFFKNVPWQLCIRGK